MPVAKAGRPPHRLPHPPLEIVGVQAVAVRAGIELVVGGDREREDIQRVQPVVHRLPVFRAVARDVNPLVCRQVDGVRDLWMGQYLCDAHAHDFPVLPQRAVHWHPGRGPVARFIDPLAVNAQVDHVGSVGIDREAVIPLQRRVCHPERGQGEIALGPRAPAVSRLEHAARIRRGVQRITVRGIEHNLDVVHLGERASGRRPGDRAVLPYLADVHPAAQRARIDQRLAHGQRADIPKGQPFVLRVPVYSTVARHVQPGARRRQQRARAAGVRDDLLDAAAEAFG